MLLTENFKKRLLELAGIPASENIILEADKRNIIVSKLKIPKEIADWAHNLSDKYAVWIADSLRKQILKNYEDTDEEYKKFANMLLNSKSLDLEKLNDFTEISHNSMQLIKDSVENYISNFKGEYEYILDWLKGRGTLAPETDQLDFKTLSFTDAKKRSEEWHKKLKEIQGGRIEGEEGDIIMTFPEGFYWIRLGKNYCSKEAEAMGHCGRATPGDILYSLRKNQFPYITAAIHEDSGLVSQMKGRANTKPKAQFHKYILPFLFDNKVKIKAFKSTYSPQTDFNINDLSDAELREVFNKKPTLFEYNGSIALRRLTDEEMMILLTKHSDVLDVAQNPNIILSDVLRNDNMIDWAIQHNPYLFDAENWGTVEFNKEQFVKALESKRLVNNLYIDHLTLDATSINYIVTYKPELLTKSQRIIQQINDEQKDYLIKNYPAAFKGFISLLNNSSRTDGLKLIDFLGIERIQILFSKEPGFFTQQSSDLNLVYKQFLTPELIDRYIRTHNKENDPFKIFGETRKLEQLEDYISNDTAMYLLVHYPEEFYRAGLMSKSNVVGGEAIGRYIFDHHFDWIEFFADRTSRLLIGNWNLNSSQKQKLINSEIDGSTTILQNYTKEEIEKINFSPLQVKELLNSNEVNFNIEMIAGLNLSQEDAKIPLVNLLDNEQDEQKRIVNVIRESYGEEYLRALYKEYSKHFNLLSLAVEFKDVERLSEYNSADIAYTKDKIKIRYDDWSDDDLLSLFDDNAREGGRSVAKTIANNELDYHNYGYKFNDISDNIRYLDEINMARLRFLIAKAFPENLKKQIMSMNYSQLVSMLEEPDEFSEENDISIIVDIKEAFVNTIEGCQRNADESEYWKLFTKPIIDLLGKGEFVDIKTKQRGSNEIKNVNMLEFEISYEKLLEFIKDAEEVDLGYNEYGAYTISDQANDVKLIIRYALEGRGDELKINEPYYGVSGYIEKGDINDRFIDLVSEDSTLSALLDKAKVVVKRKSKKEK